MYCAYPRICHVRRERNSKKSDVLFWRKTSKGRGKPYLNELNMSDHGDKPNEERLADDQEENRDVGKRLRTFSQKGLQCAAEKKHKQTITIHKRPRKVIISVERADSISDSVFNNLVATAEEFKAVLQEFQSLYEQDKYNDIEHKASLAGEHLELNHTYVLIDEIKISKSNKQLET